jgi:subtilisin family serine protease
MVFLALALYAQPSFGSQNLVAPGTVMVKMKGNSQPFNLGKSANSGSLSEKFADAGVFETKKAFQGLNLSGAELENIYSLHFSPDKDPIAIAELISSDPAVEYAEPKYLHELHATPNDPFFSNYQTHLARMNLPEAWDIIKGDSGDVIIAIIDDGVDLDHVEIADILWTNPDEIPNNGIDDDLNGFIDDIHGWNFSNNTNDPNGLYGSSGYWAHGTRVAGQLASTNNGTMYAGISWNTRMMVLNGAYQEIPLSLLWIYESMLYAAHNGANIISISGGRRGLYSQMEAEIVDYIQSLGVLVVTSAGNRNFNADFNPIYPGSYRGVLMVGATEKTNDAKASFSVYGTSVDVFAPGVDIPLIWDNDDYSVNGGSGTSFSAPQVAGLAGLIWTKYPDWTADMVREQLRVSSIPIDDVNPNFAGKMGHGRVDALRALTLTGAPSVRVMESRIKNSAGGTEVVSGDTLTVSIDLINYLSPVNNLTITASATFWALEVVDTEFSIPSLASNETSTLEVRVVIDATLPVGTILCLYLDLNGDVEGAVTSDTYVDRDYIPIHFRDYHTYNLNTGVIQTSLSSEGNIGWVDLNMEQGEGFIYKGENILREAGILIANSPDQVSDNIRSQPITEQDDDFRPLTFWDSKDNSFFKTELKHTIDDSSTANPLGVNIDQSVLYGSNQLPAIVNNCVGIIYDIANKNDHTLKNIHFGVFTDWELSGDSLDQTIYDTSRRLLYQKGVFNSVDRYAGIFLTNDEFEVHASMIDNAVVFADGFTEEEKWGMMNSSHTDPLSGVNASLMLTVGPFDLMPRQKLSFMFVLFAADKLSDVQALAGTIQNVYDTVYPIEHSDTDPEGVPSEFRLMNNFPNPFNPNTTISYELPKASLVKIWMYDVNGREIKTFHQVMQSEGFHEVTWNGRDNWGSEVGSGVYFCRIEAGGQSGTIKMVKLK